VCPSVVVSRVDRWNQSYVFSRETTTTDSKGLERGGASDRYRVGMRDQNWFVYDRWGIRLP
jgi:hypothetical protein